MNEDCQHPECTDRATEAYVDANDNGLSLCSEHYFEAVWPRGVVESITTRADDHEQPSFLEMFGGGR